MEIAYGEHIGIIERDAGNEIELGSPFFSQTTENGGYNSCTVQTQVVTKRT